MPVLNHLATFRRHKRGSIMQGADRTMKQHELFRELLIWYDSG
jgi:hypothetical protein